MCPAERSRVLAPGPLAEFPPRPMEPRPPTPPLEECERVSPSRLRAEAEPELTHSPGWNVLRHHGQCGQSCPCCRAEQDEWFGSCVICTTLKARNVAPVNDDMHSLPTHGLAGPPPPVPSVRRSRSPMLARSRPPKRSRQESVRHVRPRTQGDRRRDSSSSSASSGNELRKVITFIEDSIDKLRGSLRRSRHRRRNCQERVATPAATRPLAELRSKIAPPPAARTCSPQPVRQEPAENRAANAVLPPPQDGETMITFA